MNRRPTFSIKIRRMLSQRPATSRELAEELFGSEASPRQVQRVSALLCDMRRRGLVERLADSLAPDRPTFSGQIRQILRDGPATAREVAIEIFNGDPSRSEVQRVAAHIQRMEAKGLVMRLWRVPAYRRLPDGGTLRCGTSHVWTIGRQLRRQFAWQAVNHESERAS